MKVKRQRIEIIADILRSCSEDKLVGKTELYYGSGLSHSLFIGYVKLLVNGGFLEVVNEGNRNGKYVRTIKGSELLLDIDSVLDRIVETKGDLSPFGTTRTERSEGV